jgi:hypothetical protein
LVLLNHHKQAKDNVLPATAHDDSMFPVMYEQHQRIKNKDISVTGLEGP